MKDWQSGAVVAIATLVTLSAPFLFAQHTETVSCGEGTTEVEGVCVSVDRIQVDGIQDIYVDFLKDEYVVSQGDSVRLIFDARVYDHYIPSQFVIPDLEVDIDLSDRSSVHFIEFDATKSGAFYYESMGNCRVQIPGAGEVEVDCTIYCGETENSRSGYISVIPENS